ncbi:MAG: putative arabinose efflux permease, family [Rhodospirillales bacterium]|nr:putative arabinose efflux permease, family [Rhodospirillales bacterium]
MPIGKDLGTDESPKRAGFVLGRRVSLVVSAGVTSHTLWASAAPALTYRLYAQEWHLTHTETTGIFAVYPIAVVAMLVGFGGISDQIGRRAAMLLGLGVSLVGAVLFAVAPDVWWVFAGRAFMGVGVGLSAGPSTAAILEFGCRQDAKRAASLTMTAQAGGFAAALLVGGALTEYGPWPTHLCFWVFAVLLAAVTIATWFLPRHTFSGEKSAWRPRMPFVPKDTRRAFATASLAMMAAYTFGVLVLSLGGQVEHDLIGSSNALLNGAVLALFPIVLGPVGIVAKLLSPRFALSIGSVASVLGMGLLALAVGRHHLLIYLAGTASAGAAYSLLFVGGLGLINASGSSRHRGAVFSALYLVGYLSMGALALVLGAVATAWGLGLAVDLGAAAIAIVSLATLALAIAGLADGTSHSVPSSLPRATSGGAIDQ